jgi:hypothetical protein
MSPFQRPSVSSSSQSRTDTDRALLTRIRSGTPPLFELRREGVQLDLQVLHRIEDIARAGVARLPIVARRAALDIAALRPGQPRGGPLQCRITVTLRSGASLVAYAIDRDAVRGAIRAMQRLHTKIDDATPGGLR